MTFRWRRAGLASLHGISSLTDTGLKVAYCVHMELQVYNRPMEPMNLSQSQQADFRLGLFRDFGEGHPLPQELLLKHAQAGSRVPFMTLVFCVSELLFSDVNFFLLRCLWGHFCTTLGEREPVYNLRWSRSETVVRVLFKLITLVVLVCWHLELGLDVGSSVVFHGFRIRVMSM